MAFFSRGQRLLDGHTPSSLKFARGGALKEKRNEGIGRRRKKNGGENRGERISPTVKSILSILLRWDLLWSEFCGHRILKPVAVAVWSDLTYDVLERITSFLPFSDHYRFDVVCKNWRPVSKQRRHPPSPQLPWILINPFTRECFDLPPFPAYYKDVDVPTFIERVPDDNMERSGDFTFEKMQPLIVFKAILSHDPKERSDFTAMILFGEKNNLAFWRSDDSSWTLVNCPPDRMEDVLYFKGNFYVVSSMNVLYVVHFEPEPKLTEVGPPIGVVKCSLQKYLMDFMGNMLLIERFCEHAEKWYIFHTHNRFILPAQFQFYDLGVFDMTDKTMSKFYSVEAFPPHIGSPVWFTPKP
ncbi:hypothetical protein LUZ61_015610 [Rhynchospora tenuis]|uniref:F-box domain-containing protein n=1 Tax=Rhynchospora tenuis TaxID=198213 RepID=A0AAD6EIU4_9POAL|nr:hypothetical protein LUZ61_015610 [Rhynchospora tenuis]